ncbi:MAG: EamA family transporter [Chloroflexi bacterium]|nr:EamA family transporter [Chloroflexota bacterium]
MSRLAKGYVIALIGITVWSTTAVFIGYLVSDYKMPALLLAFWRNLLVCTALFLALFFIRRSLLRIDRSQIVFYAVYGLELAIFNSAWALSVKSNGASVATVLAYSSAGYTALLALWLFRESLGIHKLLAIMLSITGCVLVSNAYRPEMWQLNTLGLSTGLLSGVLFAGYTLFGKEAARRNINSWTSMLYSFAFGSLFLLAFNLFPSLSGTAGSLPALLPTLPTNGWIVLIVLSLGPTLMGFGLYNTSMNYLPASIANLLATLEPAMTAIEAYIFLNERLTPMQLIGSAVVLLAVIIVQFERPQRTVPIPSPNAYPPAG